MLALWLGFATAAALIAWIVSREATGLLLVTTHGIVLVLGGTAAALLVNNSFAQLGAALARVIGLLLPRRELSPGQAVAEVVRLARKAQAEGGLLAIQSDSLDFADGFLHRAIVVAVSAAETAEIRRIMETEIRQARIARQEEANIYRTIGVLAPMFGLMGTLIGMMRVLQVLSDPTKLGQAMAMALSSALFGIMLGNLICVPLAGRLRLSAMRETLIGEILLEGVLDIAAGKSAYLTELHLAAYARARADGAAAAAASPAGAPAAA